MTDALEGPRVKEPTLAEQANAPRIGRARFIGHAVGAVLLILLVEVGLSLVGFKEVRQMGTAEMTLPNRWVVLVGSVLVFLCLLDLALRRRHDRGRTGAGAAIALLALELISVASAFGLLTGILSVAAAAVCGIAGLYLLVVLAILPGTRGPNRYGPDPRDV